MAKSINQLDTNLNSTPICTGKPTNKNSRSLLLLIIVFILPILLAKLALNNQWFNLAATNQGQLLNKPLSLADLAINNDDFAKQWLIIYRLPTTCTKLCLQSIETVHNSYVLLGKYMPRVTPVLLNENIFSTQQRKQLAKSQWQVLTLSPKIQETLPAAQVLIADPLGNIILRYEPPKNAKQQANFSQAIIADMKKLLKYSKVG